MRDDKEVDEGEIPWVQRILWDRRLFPDCKKKNREAKLQR